MISLLFSEEEAMVTVHGVEVHCPYCNGALCAHAQTGDYAFEPKVREITECGSLAPYLMVIITCNSCKKRLRNLGPIIIGVLRTEGWTSFHEPCDASRKGC